MNRKVVRTVVDNSETLIKNIDALLGYGVYVGVPESQDGRNDGEPIGNATLAYIHDNGSPARGIPARPFMKPGIEKVQSTIADIMKAAAIASLKGKQEVADFLYIKAGLVAQSSIRNTIRSGIPPPLKPETIRGRKYSRFTKSRRKSEIEYMQAIKSGKDSDVAFSESGIVPLINTSQLLNSINFVVRKKG